MIPNIVTVWHTEYICFRRLHQRKPAEKATHRFACPFESTNGKRTSIKIQNTIEHPKKKERKISTEIAVSLLVFIRSCIQLSGISGRYTYSDGICVCVQLSYSVTVSKMQSF